MLCKPYCRTAVFQQASIVSAPRLTRGGTARPDCPYYGNPPSLRDNVMNKDQAKGSLEKAKGSIKETIGKVVGSDKMEAEGAADKTAGTVQKKAGEVKEAAKDAVKPIRKP